MEAKAFRIVNPLRKVALGFDRHNPLRVFWVPLKSNAVHEFNSKNVASMRKLEIFRSGENTIGLAIEPVVYNGRKIEDDLKANAKTRLKGLKLNHCVKPEGGEQFYCFTEEQFLLLMQSVSNRPLKVDK